VQKLCRSALWLRDGRVERYGSASDVCQAYLAYHEEKAAAQKRPTGVTDAALAAAAGYYALKSFDIHPGGALSESSNFAVSGEIYSPDGRAPVVLVGIVRADGTPVYGVATDMDGVAPHAIAPDRYAFAIDFPSLPLLPGKYFVRGHVLDPEGVRMFDTLEKSLTITGTAREFGMVRLHHRWRMADHDIAGSRPDASALVSGER
jgi:lipopolysaccharide transport system ATP-binding protein